MSSQQAQKRNTVIVRCDLATQLLQCDSGALPLKREDLVIVESAKGLTPATVLMAPESNSVDTELPRILRIATRADLDTVERNKKKEADALDFARNQVRALNSEIKLVSVSFNFVASRATFFFTSPDRVDFRRLVKSLAQQFRVRIDMKQIGVRDAARHTGGIGSCGRTLCCASWLPEFRPISIRTAKDQALPLNQEKLAGQCGRLRCCLRYEHDEYKKLGRSLPKLGKHIETPEGEGRVRDLDVLRQRITVQLKDGNQKTFHVSELGNGKRISLNS